MNQIIEIQIWSFSLFPRKKKQTLQVQSRPILAPNLWCFIVFRLQPWEGWAVSATGSGWGDSVKGWRLVEGWLKTWGNRFFPMMTVTFFRDDYIFNSGYTGSPKNLHFTTITGRVLASRCWCATALLPVLLPRRWIPPVWRRLSWASTVTSWGDGGTARVSCTCWRIANLRQNPTHFLVMRKYI